MSFTNTDELFGVMKDELKRMPAARPEDVWALLYENEFGPEPFDGTEEELQNGLEADMASVEYEEDAELYEYVGNGRYRLNLSALDPSEYPLSRVASDLKKSSELGGGTEAGFNAKLDWVTEHFTELKFRFSKQEWTDYLERRAEAAAEETEDDGAEKSPRSYRVIDGSLLHDFQAEKEAELPETNRILLRVVIGLILCLLAVGLAVAGRILYTKIVLK